jgi:DNA-binding CsgD family transcriptional regulator
LRGSFFVAFLKINSIIDVGENNEFGGGVMVEQSKKLRTLSICAGLFIGWLISFIYCGPLINKLEIDTNINLNIIYICLFVVSLVFFFIASRRIVLVEHIQKLLNISIVVCIVSFLAFYFKLPSFVLYFLATVIGISSILFIVFLTVYFEANLNAKNAYMLIIYSQIISYVILICTYFLSDINMYLSILFLLSCLFLALYFSYQLKINTHTMPKSFVSVKYKDLIIFSLIIILFNTADGFMLFMNSVINSRTVSTTCIYLVGYIFPCVLILFFSRFTKYDLLKKEKYLPVVGVFFAMIGLLFFNIMDGTLFIAQIGFSILDIFVFGFGLKLNVLYKKPIMLVSTILATSSISVILGYSVSNLVFVSVDNFKLTISIVFMFLLIVGNCLVFSFLQKSYKQYHLDMREDLNHKTERKNLDDIMVAYNLTEREKDILLLLIKKETYKNIALKLDIKVNTVKTHTQNVYGKFEVNSKKELINKFNCI